MELGAFTPFLFLLKAREWLYTLLEEVSGARLTHSYVRVGGVSKDLPEGWIPKVTARLTEMKAALVECAAMLNGNKIFRDRMAGVGPISRADAVAWGCTGPVGRSAGLDYDVRKDHPYSVYPELAFDVPVGTTGDCFDRYLVRMEEIQQSIRLLDQCFARSPRATPTGRS